jgi:hypothetical protein
LTNLERELAKLMVRFCQAEKAVEQRVGPLGLVETSGHTSRIESDVAGLRAGIADDSVKVEEVRREVAGLKAQFSDCFPKVNLGLTNLERELGKLKEEMREYQGQKVAMANQ